jgi:hypothetical protein
VNDVVRFNSASWIAIASSQGNDPDVSPTKWQLMADKGQAGATGATGATGAQGPAGPAGADAISLWAVVSSTGTLARGSGVVSVTRTAAGSYRVVFGQDVSTCAFVATLGYTGTGSAPSEGQGTSYVGRDAGGTDRVNVFTYDKGGSIIDRSFHLVVACP